MRIAEMSAGTSKQSLGRAPDPLFTLRPQERAAIHSVFFWSDALLATGSESGAVGLWDLGSRRQAAGWRLCEGQSACIHVDRVEALSGAPLLTQTRDGVVRVWDVQEGRATMGGGGSESGDGKKKAPLLEVQTGAYGFCRCDVAGDGGLAAATDARDRSVCMWDLRSGGRGICGTVKEPAKEGRGVSMVMHCAFAGADDGYLACCYEDGTMSLWDRRQGRWPVSGSRVHEGEGGMVIRFAIDGGMRRGVAAGTHELVVFDVDCGSDTGGLRVAERLSHPVRGLSDVRIRSDHKLFATAGWDHRVRLFTLHTAKPTPLAVLDFHTAAVHALAFSPHRLDLLATASADCRVAIWSLYPPK